MILADTSVWIDHLRNGNPDLSSRLIGGEIFCHPFIAGELSLGSLPDRSSFLKLLSQLPKAPLAQHEEVLMMIERQKLYSLGIGYVDACLIAACLLHGHLRLWTFDRRLDAVVARMGLAPV